jgi:glycosyltransferase involved in cell wall biosynthesis
VPPASAQALGKGIEQLLADPGLRVELAQRARERAHDFSTGAMLEKLGGLYRELLEVRGATR